MMMRIATAASALALITACGGGDPAELPAELGSGAVTESSAETSAAEAISPESVPAIAENIEPVENVSIEIKSEAITAAGSIDGQIFAFSPALGDDIKIGIEQSFEKAKLIAAEDVGEEYFRAHDYQYDYVKSASVGDLISVEYMEMFYTGGAHPNYTIGGILHDRSTGEEIPASALLAADGQALIKARIMDDLAAQKLGRMSMEAEDLPVIREEVEEIFPKDVEFWFGAVTLAQSIEPEKFGGLIVHFSPYDVGAYAEGSYDILIKADELDVMLAEKYAPMFSGEPAINYDSRE